MACHLVSAKPLSENVVCKMVVIVPWPQWVNKAGRSINHGPEVSAHSCEWDPFGFGSLILILMMDLVTILHMPWQLSPCSMYKIVIDLFIVFHWKAMLFLQYLNLWLIKSLWNGSWPHSTYFTHWGWDIMAAISQMTLSNAFSWMRVFEFQ